MDSTGTIQLKNATHGLNGTKFTSPDGSGSVIVGIENGTGMSFDNMSMYFSHHLFGNGRLPDFDSNNYFLSGHPAFRSLELRAVVPHNAKTITFATALGGKCISSVILFSQKASLITYR